MPFPPPPLSLNHISEVLLISPVTLSLPLSIHLPYTSSPAIHLPYTSSPATSRPLLNPFHLDHTPFSIPGRLNERRTPLGELNWIFTAITDTIAWNTLPRGDFNILDCSLIMMAFCTLLRSLPEVLSSGSSGS